MLIQCGFGPIYYIESENSFQLNDSIFFSRVHAPHINVCLLFVTDISSIVRIIETLPDFTLMASLPSVSSHCFRSFTLMDKTLHRYIYALWKQTLKSWVHNWDHLLEMKCVIGFFLLACKFSNDNLNVDVKWMTNENMSSVVLIVQFFSTELWLLISFPTDRKFRYYNHTAVYLFEPDSVGNCRKWLQLSVSSEICVILRG